MTTAKQVSDWLAALSGVFESTPLTVQIGKTSFPAARYKQRLSILENSPAWLRGEREYVREMIYCVGERPACYRRSSKTCFRFIGDSRDWYLASYVPRDANDSRFSEYHPFGEGFQLAPWNVPDGTAIDHHEPKPYARVGASWSLAA